MRRITSTKDGFMYRDGPGALHLFSAKEIGEKLPALPVVYAMAMWDDILEGWAICYVGKATSMRRRFHEHHKILSARAFGATHIHFLIERDPSRRNWLEAEMIRDLSPFLNSRQPWGGLRT